MKTFILGASGATGKELVNQLVLMGHSVKVMVRPTSTVPENWKNNDRVSIIIGHIHETSIEEMSNHIVDCNSVASCLGHNLTWKGIYGKPRKLVTNAVKLICSAVQFKAPQKPVKLVLMNTSGYRNRDLNEARSMGERIVIALLRLLLPPHTDNENAAEFLRVQIGQSNQFIEWVALRPDNLINEEKVTPLEVHPSPIRSPLFNPGKTSRINVGHFMAKLLDEQNLWSKWEGRMPVIYNKD